MPAADPQPIALVICENVYVDSGGKRALIGLFNRISASNPSGPIIQRRMCVYVSMTEVYAGTIVKVSIRNIETDQVVFSAESPPAPPDINPTTIFDLQFELDNISFSEPGTYIVSFSGNDRPLLERPITVVRTKDEKGDSDEDHEN